MYIIKQMPSVNQSLNHYLKFHDLWLMYINELAMKIEYDSWELFCRLGELHYDKSSEDVYS